MSDFHMVVCVKAVPGSTEVKMDPKTNTIVRDGKQAVINPFDASALECALALKDDFIGFGMDVRVTVVSMGIPATESLLRDCIARGADDALLLTDRAFAGADTLATTYALKCGIEALDEDFDLLICGKMAVDGDTAQIGPELAGAFEIPCVTDVSCVQSAGFTTCGSLALVHGCDAGEETVYLEMPCAMTTAKEIGQLRMPSIAGIRAAEEADVRVVNAADVNADPARCGLAGSPTQVVRSFVPDRDQTCETVDACPVIAISIERDEAAGAVDLDAYRDIWVFVQTDEHDTVTPVAYELMGKGRELADARGCRLVALVGMSPESSLGDLEHLVCAGADEVLVCRDERLRQNDAEVYARLICDLVAERKPEAILYGATAFGRELAPGVAVRLQTGLTADWQPDGHHRLPQSSSSDGNGASRHL